MEELYSSTSNHKNYLPKFSNDNYMNFLLISQNSQLLSLVSVGISNFKSLFSLFFFFFQDQPSLLKPGAIAKNSRTGGSSPFLSPGFWSLQSCSEMRLDKQQLHEYKTKGGNGHISSHCVTSFVLEILHHLTSFIKCFSFNKLHFQSSSIVVRDILLTTLQILATCSLSLVCFFQLTPPFFLCVYSVLLLCYLCLWGANIPSLCFPP